MPSSVASSVDTALSLRNSAAAAAEARYDESVDELLSALRRDILRLRPADPLSFIRDRLASCVVPVQHARTLSHNSSMLGGGTMGSGAGQQNTAPSSYHQHSTEGMPSPANTCATSVRNGSMPGLMAGVVGDDAERTTLLAPVGGGGAGGSAVHFSDNVAAGGGGEGVPTDDVQEFLARAPSTAFFPQPSECSYIPSKYPRSIASKPLSIVVFGASGDLAKKKTFPALFGLYVNGLLPRNNNVACGDEHNGSNNTNMTIKKRSKNILNILGYARTDYATQKEFRDHLRPLLEKSAPMYAMHVESFLQHIHYVCGGNGYTDPVGYARLRNALEHHEGTLSGEGGEGNAFPSDDAEFKALLEKDPAPAAGDTDDASVRPLQAGNRLFYLALPPTAFIDTCTSIRTHLIDCSGPTAFKTLIENLNNKNYATDPLCVWSRVVVEKPFGHDTKSSNVLADSLNKLFHESQIYRIDHYLGKEMVQNVVSLRFANHVFSSVWSNKHVHSVQIVFKEKIGTEGRGGYFDSFGIIRDVIQNHLCQILALVGMEKPRTLSAEDVRDEKVALLRCIEPVAAKDCVIGQYTANSDMKGYKDDDGVPKDSKTPTFAIMKLNINNDRWAGVPFILKAGKALEDKCVTVRIQFKEELRPFSTRLPLTREECEALGEDCPMHGAEGASSFSPTTTPLQSPNAAGGGGAGLSGASSGPTYGRIVGPNRNELVIRAQPNEAMYLKINTKSPGVSAGNSGDENGGLTLTELDLTYGNRFNVRLPEAYESLVNEAILGNSTNFVRRDELDASWRIFTPLLHAIDAGKVAVHEYQAGTRGPAAAEEILKSIGYRRSRDYNYAAGKV